MRQSEQINELATALAQAQSEITAAKKSTENEFFRSKYADLSDVWDVIRGPLTRNSLAVIQLPSCHRLGDGSGPVVRVETIIAHASGQFISDCLDLVPVRDDPQGVGSAITYARRYALAAAVGVAQDDDDGNAATHTDNNASMTGKSVKATKRQAAARVTREELTALADQLGIPQGARRAMLDDANGDLSVVKERLESALKEKRQREAETQS